MITFNLILLEVSVALTLNVTIKLYSICKVTLYCHCDEGQNEQAFICNIIQH